MKRSFIDTNVLVYANDARDSQKQEEAAALIAGHLREGSGVISMQVLQEYANTALAKLHQDEDVVLRLLHLLGRMTVVTPSPRLLRRQIELRKVYDINFWDAGIVAAAEESDCDEILSEDFNTGQYYAGILTVSPFL